MATLALAVATAGPMGLMRPAAAEADAGASAPAAFIERLGDVPLMPGLAIVEKDGVDFDAPDGRIVEVTAAGAVPRAAVLSFYRQSLPPLGWTGQNLVYQREGERLRIELAGTGARTEVRFFLAPAR
ncbi:MAG TPA: hypothetical protein VMV26_20195 [Alphaproteobacteria bacterium]|nr:hypothetical protein [Alphaproteobacteria bacterium]